MARNDRVVATSSDGSIEIRTTDNRMFTLLRVADNQELQNIGDLEAAKARAEALSR